MPSNTFMHAISFNIQLKKIILKMKTLKTIRENED